MIELLSTCKHTESWTKTTGRYFAEDILEYMKYFDIQIQFHSIIFLSGLIYNSSTLVQCNDIATKVTNHYLSQGWGWGWGGVGWGGGWGVGVMKEWYMLLPADARRTKCHYNIKTTSQRGFDVMMTLLLRHVSAGAMFCDCWYGWTASCDISCSGVFSPNLTPRHVASIQL